MNDRAKRFRYLPLVGLFVVVMLAGGGVYWMVRSFLNSARPLTKPVVQEIHVIRPPPPPPDEPPPPPPPPEEKVEVHEQQQEPDPTPSNEPPPSEQLGLDAEGSAGGDAFGLVGNKGGRELLASGGSAVKWYGGLVKNQLLERLQDLKEAHRGSYTLDLRVWVQADGTIRVQVEHSSGDKERDRAIEKALTGQRISEPPPPDMPSIDFRFVSRA